MATYQTELNATCFAGARVSRLEAANDGGDGAGTDW
jgi:hypothetical protein